ncbi:MAG: 30S ribosomal protein S20 [Patescibacteria group bacterium]|nr:30S ribosomal protein S20 [Patescibacteria group bacterium]MCL5258027.1 30S ribosomal protein S20 [Patescibacteria group bacterium]
MPITSSGQKALRQSLRRKERNLKKKVEIKKTVKALKKSILSGDQAAAKENLRQTFKKLDKAAKSFIHKNKASRLKSRLSKKVNKAFSPKVK